mmetsp:Transcript_48153/g.127509  ORF Transcript_48153/g.127509 Transcript_48153/m.127509 type:complete len:359 (-) Transcript_48153:98-1174(-)
MCTFEADLQKFPGTGLGIDVGLSATPTGMQLVVERVKDNGSVVAWNQRSPEPQRIRRGDLILRVNGLEGDVRAMASELASGPEVRITVAKGGLMSLAQAITGSGIPGGTPRQGHHVLQHVPQPDCQEQWVGRQTAERCFSAQSGRFGLPRPEAPEVPPTTALDRSNVKPRALDVALAADRHPHTEVAHMIDSKVQQGRRHDSNYLDVFPGAEVVPQDGAAKSLQTAAFSMMLDALGRSFVAEDPRVDRLRGSCGGLAPIGTGRSGPAPKSRQVHEVGYEGSGDFGGDQASTSGNDENKDDGSRSSPAFIVSMLQLDDSELAELLTKALVLRPWLLLPIKKAASCFVPPKPNGASPPKR